MTRLGVLLVLLDGWVDGHITDDELDVLADRALS